MANAALLGVNFTCCGLGNLTVAAALKGLRVTALDASPAAIDHLNRRAAEENLPITARETDLRQMEISGEFDSVAAIGLPMFFPQRAARAALAKIKGLARPGALAAVNVLIEGTTFMDMFDPAGHYLFGENELQEVFADWVTE